MVFFIFLPVPIHFNPEWPIDFAPKVRGSALLIPKKEIIRPHEKVNRTEFEPSTYLAALLQKIYGRTTFLKVPFEHVR